MMEILDDISKIPFEVFWDKFKEIEEVEEVEEVECNMCGSLMWYDEKNGIYVCTNSECTRCND